VKLSDIIDVEDRWNIQEQKYEVYAHIYPYTVARVKGEKQTLKEAKVECLLQLKNCIADLIEEAMDDLVKRDD